jgi:hypothetical protein
MVIFVYDDLVENEVRLPLIREPTRGFRKQLLVTIANVLLREVF